MPQDVLHELATALRTRSDESIAEALVDGTPPAHGLRQRREEYLAFVAHDLRTPLNVISLSARVLESVIHDLQPAASEVGVDSKPGKGSTFRFTLPRRRSGMSR